MANPYLTVSAELVLQAFERGRPPSPPPAAAAAAAAAARRPSTSPRTPSPTPGPVTTGFSGRIAAVLPPRPISAAAATATQAPIATTVAVPAAVSIAASFAQVFRVPVPVGNAVSMGVFEACRAVCRGTHVGVYFARGGFEKVAITARAVLWWPRHHHRYTRTCLGSVVSGITKKHVHSHVHIHTSLSHPHYPF